MSLPSTSIKRPVTVTMFYLGIALIALYAFTRIGVDLLLPQSGINIPHLLVQTNYANASTEEIEKLVTEPLESAAVVKCITFEVFRVNSDIKKDIIKII